MTITPADREKLDALYARCSKGFDVLFQREQAGQMDRSYGSWYGTWEGLLSDYEALLDMWGLTK